jgi:NAD/NADP transhydrogenase beta subunit
LIILSGIYGVLFVMGIGGADMPVVICVLNSGSGWAGVFSGFMLKNNIMIISGSFVGASGIILTIVMCTAMNRTIGNVLAGGFGDTGKVSTKAVGEVTKVDISEVTNMVMESKNIIIIPG